MPIYNHDQLSENTRNWIIIFRAVSEDIFTRTENLEVNRQMMIAVQASIGSITRDRSEKLRIFSVLTGRYIHTTYALHYCEMLTFLKLYASSEFRMSLQEILNCPLI